MHNTFSEQPVIAIFGLGYVGSVTAAGLASLGHRVIGVDCDARKVAAIQAGEAPFHERGLRELVASAVRFGRLTATGDGKAAVGSADIAMICVGTPCGADGTLDSRQLEAVAAEIAGEMRGREEPLIVVTRSTILPGLCEQTIQSHFDAGERVSFVANPEFLREGQAVDDFLRPALMVVGGEDVAAVQAVANLYRSLDVEPMLTGLRTAEMIKYAWNALHAVKIDFANEIGAVCASVGIGADPVMEAVCRERGQDFLAYMRPGFAFGGSCLGKDLRALLSHARTSELALPLLEAVLPSNERQLDRTMQLLSRGTTDAGGGAARLGVFGLAFKEGTDDVRESAPLRFIVRLMEAGRQVRVFDPSFHLDTIYGSNLEWLRAAIPNIEDVVVRNVREFLAWSDEILLVHRPDAELLDEILLSGLPVRALYSGNPDRIGNTMRLRAQAVE